MSNNSDEKLIKAAIEDDTDAIETLKDRIKSVTVSAIEKRGMQRSDENAEMFMSEIEQKVLNALHHFRFRGPFETRVYRITVNMILEFQRRVFSHHPI